MSLVGRVTKIVIDSSWVQSLFKMAKVGLVAPLRMLGGAKTWVRCSSGRQVSWGYGPFKHSSLKYSLKRGCMKEL